LPLRLLSLPHDGFDTACEALTGNQFAPSSFKSIVRHWLKQRSVRVTVISSIASHPPMIADELRRQADQFTYLIEMRPLIAREITNQKCLFMDERDDARSMWGPYPHVVTRNWRGVIPVQRLNAWVKELTSP
jgi:hypothetical protein